MSAALWAADSPLATEKRREEAATRARKTAQALKGMTFMYEAGWLNLYRVIYSGGLATGFGRR